MNEFNKENLFLISAITEGNIEKVLELIPLCDIQAFHNEALNTAVKYKRVECVNALIAAANEPIKDSRVLVTAVEAGNLEMVRLLLPVTDPKGHNSEALQSAAMHCSRKPVYKSIVDLLFDVSDPEIALFELKKKMPSEPYRWCYLEERVEQKRLHTTLSVAAENAAPNEHTNFPRKRM